MRHMPRYFLKVRFSINSFWTDHDSCAVVYLHVRLQRCLNAAWCSANLTHVLYDISRLRENAVAGGMQRISPLLNQVTQRYNAPW